ncbi:MAG: hypothetical protein BWY11_00952 [Firmicutes bacterium ADurb.Bin182]|nr:MAG: hypothetical protein BWY11_00952 [Firmicutes bacterium ADurb.Bin182]
MKRCKACKSELPDEAIICTGCAAVLNDALPASSPELMNIYLKQLTQDMAAQKNFEKKQLWHARLRSCLSVAAFIIFIAVLIAAVPSVNKILVNMNDISAELAKVEFVEMTESVTTIAVRGTESIDYAMEELDTALSSMDEALKTVTMIDVEALNKSIQDLSAIIAPLAVWFGG